MVEYLTSNQSVVSSILTRYLSIMYLLILYLPLISSISSGLLGRYLGERGSGIFSTLCIFLTFLISLNIFVEVLFYNSVSYLEL